MSRARARTLSWLAVLAVMAAGVVGLRALPGRGGLTEELRWRLRNGPTGGADRTNQLFWTLTERDPERGAALLAELLHDDNVNIKRGALALLLDHVPWLWPHHQIRPEGVYNGWRGLPLVAILRSWFQHADFAEKMGTRPYSVRACTLMRVVDTAVPAPTSKSVRGWRPAPTLANRRWLVASTNLRDLDARAAVHCELFALVGETPDRLRVLDALPTYLGFLRLRSDPDKPARALTPAELVAELQIPVAELVGMLDDPHPEVRQGAGRILTVAGDPRGLPAFCEWLQQHPNLPPAAEAMLADLYGEDWRTQCESGGAAREPGGGDG